MAQSAMTTNGLGERIYQVGRIEESAGFATRRVFALAMALLFIMSTYKGGDHDPVIHT
jgi:hypothetical protein